MKIKDGYLLREVAGTHIVVPIGAGAMDFSGVISLNEVGAFIWNQLESETTKDKVLEALLSEYNVDRETALEDIDEFIEKLKGAELLG